MRELRIVEHISLDGAIQHTPGENDYTYGDWTAPYRTPAGRELVTAAYGQSFDLLLGRSTYDLWAGSWPMAPASPMADRINAATKYVVTHRPESLDWGPFAGLGTDVVDSVRGLKAQDGPDLVLSGSSTLTSTLLEHGLVDDLVLITYPLLLGAGKRLFAEGTPAQCFEFVTTTATPSGVRLNTYRFAGPLA